MSHNGPEGIASRQPLLTQKQFDLLAWVYLKGYREVGHSQVTWSPRAYMGRSLGRSEAATLSKRVSTLVDQGSLNRWGKDLKLTDLGKRRLKAYVQQNLGSPQTDILSARLELDEEIVTLEAYGQVLKALRRYREKGELTQEEGDHAEAALLPVHRAVLKQISEGAITLSDVLEINPSI